MTFKDLEEELKCKMLRSFKDSFGNFQKSLKGFYGPWTNKDFQHFQETRLNGPLKTADIINSFPVLGNIRDLGSKVPEISSPLPLTVQH